MRQSETSLDLADGKSERHKGSRRLRKLEVLIIVLGHDGCLLFHSETARAGNNTETGRLRYVHR